MLEFEWLTALCPVALSAVWGHSEAEDCSRQSGLEVNDCSVNRDNKNNHQRAEWRSFSALETGARTLLIASEHQLMKNERLSPAPLSTIIPEISTYNY